MINRQIFEFDYDLELPLYVDAVVALGTPPSYHYQGDSPVIERLTVYLVKPSDGKDTALHLDITHFLTKDQLESIEDVLIGKAMDAR